MGLVLVYGMDFIIYRWGLSALLKVCKTQQRPSMTRSHETHNGFQLDQEI